VRTIGKRVGILVFLGDFFKSFVAVALVLQLQPTVGISNADLTIATMLGAVLGHNSPMFFNFKCGKGVAVTMGGISTLMPGTAGVSLLLWLVVFHATRFVSATSLFFMISLLIPSFAFAYSMHSIVLVIFMSMVFFCATGVILGDCGMVPNIALKESSFEYGSRCAEVR